MLLRSHCLVGWRASIPSHSPHAARYRKVRTHRWINRAKRTTRRGRTTPPEEGANWWERADYKRLRVVRAAGRQVGTASGPDVLGAQLVTLVSQSGLVPDAVAALGQRQHVQVADINNGRVLDLGEASALPGAHGQAGAFEPVLLGRGPAVVGG